ncbi:MAG: YfhO family protein [Saprospiraceae bacterium]|nr:YfhO family protein [Saprospiraceae bacterium]
MVKIIGARVWPHLVAYLVMILVSFMLFRPYVLENKVLSQGDNQRAKAMQTEIQKYRAIDGEAPLWTNAMFSGMPAYMIWHTARGNMQQYVGRALLWFHAITKPHYIVLLAMAMCYLALFAFGADWRIALLGGISYGISTYFVDLAEAGHSTKMLAMAYLPGVWAAAMLLIKRKWLLGTGLMSLMVGLQIQANHIQITYYTFLLLGVGMIFYGVQSFKSGQLKAFATALGLMAAATGLGVASNMATLWPTWEYSKETIRGTSELKAKANSGGGLDKDYAFAWSYGIGESSTLLVPNAYGGGASQTFEGTETYKRIFPNMVQNFTRQGMSRQEAVKSAEQQVSALFYHGEQSFVGVAIYFGAGLIFLFVLGILLVGGPVRWWLITATAFALTIAWGKHFFLNDLLFDYFPLFNKFRAVSMALGLSHFALVLLAMLGLQQFLNSTDRERSLKALYTAAGVTGALTLLILIAGGMMNMTGANDEAVGADLARILQADRASVLRSDAFRSLGIILLTAGVLWAYLKDKLKLTPALLLVGAVVVGDVWMVDSRILFPAKYESERTAEADPQPSQADLSILDDPDPYFRVLDMTTNPFVNAKTSLFHKSLGGYHAAKLMRYQELIEAYLMNPGQHLDILRMLNTKYILQQQENRSIPVPIDHPFGNAWFVNTLSTVSDADQELADIALVPLQITAVIQEQNLPEGWKTAYKTDSLTRVRLTSYHPDTLTYQYSNNYEGFLVFSEVYYPPAKGWQLYLNGEPFDDFVKVDYLLRGVRVPAGQNQEITMVFHPQSVYTGQKIALAGSILSFLILFAGLWQFFRKEEIPEAVTLHEPVHAPSDKGSRKKKRS